MHGNGGSPCLIDDLLIFSCDGLDLQKVVALDSNTGKTRWQTLRKANPTKPFSFGTPLVINVAGQKQVISVGSEVVMALNPTDGKEIWRVRTNGYSQVPRPVYAQGLLFICSGFDAPELLAIRPTGQGDVTSSHIVWKCTRNVPNTPSPIAVADGLYMISDNGVLTQLDVKTGQVRWQERLPGNFSASPIAAGDLLYFLNEKGVCYMVQSGSAFKLIGKNTMSGQTLASLAAADGKLFIRTDKALVCID